MRSVLDAARDAYREQAEDRKTFPILGGTVGLVLSEPDGFDGYKPLATEVAGMEPDPEKDAEFIAAAVVDVVAMTEDGEEPIIGDDGSALDLLGFASALTGGEITSSKQAVYTLFSRGEPPKLKKYELANLAFMFRTVLSAGVNKALSDSPEA